MKYITATTEMADGIRDVLHTTIKNIYPRFYPKEVVDFFCNHHSREHVLEGIVSGTMGVLIDEDVIIGTGCYYGNHITGVYVLPKYQIQERLSVLAAPRMVRSTFLFARLRSAGGVYLSGGLKPATETSRILTAFRLRIPSSIARPIILFMSPERIMSGNRVST